jgi:hypothetical protein
LWSGKAWSKCLLVWTLLYISYIHILIDLTSFLDILCSITIFYRTCITLIYITFAKIVKNHDHNNFCFIILGTRWYRSEITVHTL